MNIESSSCLGMFRVKPAFLNFEQNADTTRLKILARMNCAGFHNPSVEVKNDSVCIHLKYGAMELTPTSEMDEQELSYYLDEDESDSIPEFVERISTAVCDCAFILDAEVLGLKSEINYHFFFNQDSIMVKRNPERFSFRQDTDSFFC